MYLQGLNLSFSKASCHVIRLSSKWRVLLKNYYLICLVTRVCTQDVCNVLCMQFVSGAVWIKEDGQKSAKKDPKEAKR